MSAPFRLFHVVFADITGIQSKRQLCSCSPLLLCVCLSCPLLGI